MEVFLVSTELGRFFADSRFLLDADLLEAEDLEEPFETGDILEAGDSAGVDFLWFAATTAPVVASLLALQPILFAFLVQYTSLDASEDTMINLRAEVTTTRSTSSQHWLVFHNRVEFRFARLYSRATQRFLTAMRKKYHNEYSDLNSNII